LARAHHLSTETTPKVYYRPYVLLNEQSAIIDGQIAEVRAKIEEEGVTVPRRDSVGDDVKPEGVLKDSERQDSRSSTAKDDEEAS
jgi:hypothetical protein